jgi:hypothetical protein
MVQIFVSYSHLERRWIDETDPHNIIPYLAQSLARENVQVWFDDWLIAGEKYKEVIEARINSADIGILLVSQACGNPHCHREPQ